jgi:hypothetical protein
VKKNLGFNKGEGMADQKISDGGLFSSSSTFIRVEAALTISLKAVLSNNSVVEEAISLLEGVVKIAKGNI